MSRPIALFAFAVCLSLWGCTQQNTLGDPPPYTEKETGTTTTMTQYNPGPDPFEEGENRLTLDDSYEGPFTDVLIIDDVSVFYYIYNDTFSRTQDYDEAREGLFSYRVTSKGRGWWGGGTHLTKGVIDLSSYQTLNVAAKTNSSELVKLTISMQTLDGSADASVYAESYGFKADGEWHSMQIPLSAFVENGADLTSLTAPLITVGDFAATEGEELWLDDIYVTDHTVNTDTTVTTTDTTEPEITGLLVNGGFEKSALGVDDILRPTNWEVYPKGLTNYSTVYTGDPLEGSVSETFTALGDMASMRVVGTNTGSESETAIYQTFSPVAGATYTFTGSAMMPSANALADSHTYALLQIKMFSSSWNMVDNYETQVIDLNSTPDTWTELSVSGSASGSVAYVQAAVEFWQCVGEESDCTGGDGSVYFDNLTFTQSQ